jgi:two-component system, NtrC family, sensor kinase
MKCPRCQQDNPPHATFCLACGTPVADAPSQPRGYADLKGENERLRRSLSGALEQQTATSEILRVIANSPTDVQPVFDTILASATTLLGGFVASITRRVGDDVYMAAFTSISESLDATVRQSYPVSIDSPNPHSVAIRRCEPHIIADADTQPDIPEPIRRMARARGWRSNLAVPLRRTGRAIGALGVSRRDARGFTPDEIALLQTFADQAVIAIENVRLFKDLEARNQQLTEGLDQQRATSEILRVISSSPTDVQPVFDTIVKSAGRLCEAAFATVNRFDGTVATLGAHYNLSLEELEVVKTRVFPFRPTRATVSGRALLNRATVHVHDIGQDPEYTPVVQALERYRTGLSVPMLRDGVPIGTITLWRDEVRPFTAKQIAMVETFADQAVIAIENVRLFKELEARNSELTQADERRSADHQRVAD